jgi:hypothetical protein
MWTAFVACAGMLLLCVTRIEVVLLLGFLLWFVVALPYALVVSLVRVTKAPVKRTSVREAPLKTPKTPTKRELAAQAKAEYEETKGLALLIDDELTRKRFLAEAETRFRQRLAEIMRAGGA